MQTKQQANKKLLSEMLNKCIELKAMQSELIESEYSFNSCVAKITDKVERLEISILDCINNLNE